MELPTAMPGNPGAMTVAVSGKGVQICARMSDAKPERYVCASTPLLMKTPDVSARAASSFVSSELLTSTPNA